MTWRRSDRFRGVALDAGAQANSGKVLRVVPRSATENWPSGRRQQLAKLQGGSPTGSNPVFSAYGR